MNSVVGLDWRGYFHSLSDGETRELAAWLAAERLKVGEFMEIVDRAYARTSVEWRGQPPVFVAWFGRPAARDYARRRRRFAGLTAALEDAYMTGALPDAVAPEELEPTTPRWPEAPSMTKVLGELDYARRCAQ